MSVSVSLCKIHMAYRHVYVYLRTYIYVMVCGGDIPMYICNSDTDTDVHETGPCTVSLGQQESRDATLAGDVERRTCVASLPV